MKREREREREKERERERETHQIIINYEPRFNCKNKKNIFNFNV